MEAFRFFSPKHLSAKVLFSSFNYVQCETEQNQTANEEEYQFHSDSNLANGVIGVKVPLDSGAG